MPFCQNYHNSNDPNFISGLFSAGGMGLWHGVEFYENEKLVGEREFLRPKVILLLPIQHFHNNVTKSNCHYCNHLEYS